MGEIIYGAPFLLFAFWIFWQILIDHGVFHANHDEIEYCYKCQSYVKK